jgi:hypothetical protein
MAPGGQLSEQSQTSIRFKQKQETGGLPGTKGPKSLKALEDRRSPDSWRFPDSDQLICAWLSVRSGVYESSPSEDLPLE